jgi:cytochrome c556
MPGRAKSLPAIWRQWPKFQAEAERLALQAGKLGQSAASGDPKEVAAQYRSLGQVCLDCHQTFRAKR